MFYIAGLKMTLRGRNRSPNFSCYRSNTIDVSSPIACAYGDCLGEVRRLGPQPSTRGNAIPTVPVEVTNFSTSIRLYWGEMFHCMLADCVRHRAANCCRRRRYSWFIASNIDCLIFADLLASFFLYDMLYVHNIR